MQLALLILLPLQSTLWIPLALQFGLGAKKKAKKFIRPKKYSLFEIRVHPAYRNTLTRPRSSTGSVRRMADGCPYLLWKYLLLGSWLHSKASRNSGDEFLGTWSLASSNLTLQSISAGNFHFAAVSTSGALFTWGKNSSGQVGRPLFLFSYSYKLGRDTNFPTVPRLVTHLTLPVHKISCGSYHTQVIVSENPVHKHVMDLYVGGMQVIHPPSDVPRNGDPDRHEYPIRALQG